MDRIFLSGAVQNAPNVPDDVDPGYPTDGSSGGGIASTIPGAIWYNAVMMELINAIKGGDLTPDRHDNSQLNASIDARIKKVGEALTAAVAKLQDKVAQVEVVPPGMIMFFSNTTAPNSNWLICDGRAVSRTAYANLFATIGTRFGGGNGSTTFNVPYLIDRVAWGGVGNVGEYRQPGLPNITGTFDGNADDGQGWKTGAFYLSGSSSGANGDGKARSGVIAFDASRSNGIYGRSNTVQPPALVLLPCIHI